MSLPNTNILHLIVFNKAKGQTKVTLVCRAPAFHNQCLFEEDFLKSKSLRQGQIKVTQYNIVQSIELLYAVKHSHFLEYYNAYFY